MIGENKSGKTALITRLVEDKFTEEAKITNAPTNYSKNFRSGENKGVKFMISDMPSGANIQNFTVSMGSNLAAVFLVFDLGNRESYT